MTKTQKAAASVREINKALKQYVEGLEVEDRQKVKLEIHGQEAELVFRGPKLKIPGYLEPGFYEISLLDPDGETFLQTPMVVDPPEEPEDDDWIDDEANEPTALPYTGGNEQFAQAMALMSQMHQREIQGLQSIFDRQREMDREYNQRLLELHRESNQTIEKRVREQMREFVKLQRSPEAPEPGEGSGLDGILSLVREFVGKPDAEPEDDE